MTGTKMLEVPYRGSSLAFPDLLSGRVDLFFDSTPAAMPYVKSGQVKGIAILTSKRLSEMPDVPTMTESGVPELEIEFLDRDFRAGENAARRSSRVLQKHIAEAGPEMKPRLARLRLDLQRDADFFRE